MDQSLSIILPVHNAELYLASRIQRLIDVIADLTNEIEILIVDDGSTDSTEEIASELAKLYPQVSIVRRRESIGVAEAANVGIQRTKGESILIHDISEPWSDDIIRQLWSMRKDEELVVAHSESTGIKRPHMANQRATSSTKLVRRKAMNELQSTHSAASIIRRVTRDDLTPSQATQPQ